MTSVIADASSVFDELVLLLNVLPQTEHMVTEGELKHGRMIERLRVLIVEAILNQKEVVQCERVNWLESQGLCQVIPVKRDQLSWTLVKVITPCGHLLVQRS